MSGNRMARVGEEVRRELGDLLQHRMSDPRVTWVSVTRVDVSRDLSHAKVYVSRLGEEDALTEALAALEKAAPMLRRELGRRMRLRRVPELHFLPDVGLLHSLRVSQILGEIDLGDEKHSERTESEDVSASESTAPSDDVTPDDPR